VKRWTYEPSPLLDRSLREQLSSFPREPDLAVSGLRWLGMLAMRAVLRLYFRVRIEGRERIPATGPFVLVANHSSHLDAVVLSCALPGRQWNHTYAAAAQDYFFRSVFRSLAAVVFVNAMPFDREQGSEKSLELCADVLHVARQGLIMFPEGTRSPDGRIGRFRSGVGRLLAGTPVPAVPAYIEGAHAAWPKGSVLPRPYRVRVRIGAPRAYPSVPRTREGAAEIAGDLEAAVRALAGAERAAPA
jgi:1-acyl-sn-glycerol-3-phosphate acyltransferase